MIHLVDEPSCQELSDFFPDRSSLYLVKAPQALLHRPGTWPDLQGVLRDFTWNARHVRGLPHNDILVDMEKVDKRSFLFGGEHCADPYGFVGGVFGVD